MNGNTERAQCALSLVCIPQEMAKKGSKKHKNKFIKYLKSVIKKSCHLVPKVVIDLPFEGRKVEGSRKYRRRERVPKVGSRREETITEPINFRILSLFYFLSKIFSFLTGLSSLQEPSGFWHLALPVGVCSLECNDNNNNNNTVPFFRYFSSFFLLLDIDFFFFVRDTDAREGAACPFCVPIHKNDSAVVCITWSSVWCITMSEYIVMIYHVVVVRWYLPLLLAVCLLLFFLLLFVVCLLIFPFFLFFLFFFFLFFFFFFFLFSSSSSSSSLLFFFFFFFFFFFRIP